MSKRKTHEQYCSEIYNIFKDDFTILSEYVNSNIKVLAKHKCGYEWNVLPLLLKRAKSCPRCTGLKKKTQKEFNQEVFDLYSEEYTVLGKYVNTMTKIEFRHNTCGRTFLMSPDSFLHNHKCPLCMEEQRNIKKTFSYDKVKSIIESEIGYELLSEEYINSKTKLLIRCKENHITEQTLDDFQTSVFKCPECFKESDRAYNIKTYEEVKDLFEQNRYKLKTDHYICGDILLDCTCPNGHDIQLSYYDMLHDKRCYECNLPRGEERILNYLKLNNIPYKQQYSFQDCRNINILHFDFAVFNDDSSLKCLIEFQGQQHYEPNGYFGGKEKFKAQQKNDNIKREYCRLNKITLHEIHYKKLHKIEEELDKIFYE